MANLIQTIVADGPISWSQSLTISDVTGAVLFRIVGGEFDTGDLEKTVAPDEFGMYVVGINANGPTDQKIAKSVLVYYDFHGDWALSQTASRNLICSQSREIDYRLLTQGFDALPLGATVDPAYGGLVLGGGVSIPTSNALANASTVKLETLESVPFESDLPIMVTYDRDKKILYWLSVSNNLADVKKYGQINSVDLASAVVRYSPYSHRREVILFHRSGKIEQYNSKMVLVQTLSYTDKLNHVVYRKKGVGINQEDSFILFDTYGKARFYSGRFDLTEIRQDHFYVSASDSFDVMLTLEGKLIGSSVSNAPDVFWYQFTPASVVVTGVDKSANNGDKIYQFNIRDNIQHAPARPLVADDLLVYNTTASWSNLGGLVSSGYESNGRNTVFDFTSPSTPATTGAFKSFLGLTTQPYGNDPAQRKFFFIARPALKVKHISTRNYDAVLPTFDHELGTSVTFTFTAVLEDTELSLPITLPEGIEWSAKVNGTPGRYARNGDEVTVTATHEYMTQTPFPVSLGRSSGLVEVQPDSLPDAFHFRNAFNLPEDYWYDTETLTITGINVLVPVSVTLDGGVDYERVKILVNGTETEMPVYIRNNDTLAFSLHHDTISTPITVTVGDYTDRFGLYTITEAKLKQSRNWAYMPVGSEVMSDVFVNTGQVTLDLVITEGEAEWIQGGQTLSLAIGASTRLRYTPSESKKNVVRFNSVLFDYEWQVWSHDHWLDDQPMSVRGERYVYTETADITFDSVPENFWTNIHVPAGIILEKNGIPLNVELDSRGVYNTTTELNVVECASLILVMGGYPSQDQPHTLYLGDAKIEWLYNMTVDPTYSYRPVVGVTQILLNTVQRITSVFKTAIDAVTKPRVSIQEINASYITQELKETTFGTIFQDVVLDRHADIDMSYKGVTSEIPRVFDTPFVHILDTHKYGETDTEFFHVLDNHTHDTTRTEFEIKTDICHEFLTAPGINVVHWIKPSSEINAAPAHRVTSVDSMAQGELIPNSISSTAVSGVLNEVQLSLQGTLSHIPNDIRAENRAASNVIQVRNDIRLAHRVTLTPHSIIPAAFSWIEDGSTNKHDVFGSSWSESSPSYLVGASDPRTMVLPYAAKVNTEAHAVPSVYPYSLGMGVRVVRRVLPQTNIKPPVAREYYEYQYYHIAMGQRDAGRTVTYQHSMIPNNTQALEPILHESLVPVWGIQNKRQMESSEATDVQRNVIQVASMPKRSGTTVFMSPINLLYDGINGRDRAVFDSIEYEEITEPKKAVFPASTVFSFETIPVDEGQPDQLKNGYFETELDALTNAVEVWGHAPERVYGIQQPDGYWTWALVVPCESSCGDAGCDVRGYISGG
ncbi:hypothetical protein fHeYen902_040c [Yersinia phage fHe-Yen9-02]|nr:hypothetical protein fHeYen902_040c [Yersinia phage fHe-Yen9-02]